MLDSMLDGDGIIGKSCKLLRTIRDNGGKSRFQEENPIIIRKVINLEREMLLIQFNDGTSTFVFLNEIDIL